MHKIKEISLEALPEVAKKELYDFYEYLTLKYGKNVSGEIGKKKKYLESVAQHIFKLPTGYKFNREEIYER